ncbi:hypothetical protein [Streptomyces sp. BPTC-684]|uniref:hypothetical protein n=1 Tax=Streptomyces sp. BPTC-684 TaxID=3043734 RepID=UPI0024B2548B|nr:hypothetical protein [Streptomyces sp. BPTC-684]WHM36610.1 hypothetical protein QIY60_06420 [Streptomyces sp. BPTC-684]
MESHIPHAGPGAHCHECWVVQQTELTQEKAKAEAKERAGERIGPPLVAAALVLLVIGSLWLRFIWGLAKALG